MSITAIKIPIGLLKKQLLYLLQPFTGCLLSSGERPMNEIQADNHVNNRKQNAKTIRTGTATTDINAI